MHQISVSVCNLSCAYWLLPPLVWMKRGPGGGRGSYYIIQVKVASGKMKIFSQIYLPFFMWFSYTTIVLHQQVKIPLLCPHHKSAFRWKCPCHENITLLGLLLMSGQSAVLRHAAKVELTLQWYLLYRSVNYLSHFSHPLSPILSHLDFPLVQ